jgi:hypothetical protein
MGVYVLLVYVGLCTALHALLLSQQNAFPLKLLSAMHVSQPVPALDL